MPKIEGSEVSASVNEKRFDERLSLFLLPALAVSLIATNRWFTVIDDEAFIIDRAAKPARQTIQLFLSGVGEHQHPPLYDLILHGWLRLTNGNMHLLRLPAIVFFVLGVWVLAMAAKLLGLELSRLSACGHQEEFMAETLFRSEMPSHERRMSLPDGHAYQVILMES